MPDLLGHDGDKAVESCAVGPRDTYPALRPPRTLKSVDIYAGREKQIMDRREKIKRWTLQLRRQLNLGNTKCVP